MRSRICIHVSALHRTLRPAGRNLCVPRARAGKGAGTMRDNPNLSPKQIDRIRSVAQLRSVQADDVLYEPSQPDVPLFIVLEGNVSISRTGEDEKILAVREANQFTGEMSVICGKRSLLKARVTGDGSALELSRDKVLSLMAKTPSWARSSWRPSSPGAY